MYASNCTLSVCVCVCACAWVYNTTSKMFQCRKKRLFSISFVSLFYSFQFVFYTDYSGYCHNEILHNVNINIIITKYCDVYYYNIHNNTTSTHFSRHMCSCTRRKKWSIMPSFRSFACCRLIFFICIKRGNLVE